MRWKWLRSWPNEIISVRKKYKFIIVGLIAAAIIAVAVWYLRRVNIPVLEPAGQIASKERRLIFIALGLAVIIVVPVYTLLVVFAWRYREDNPKAKYSPELDHNRYSEITWWVVPTIIISILSVITWQSSHELDPYRPIASKIRPINIQVIALDWKWLFVYPDQRIASVNYFQVPVNTPVNFQITSDAPMNSFWIPQLGGQIYAMPGMVTQLNLIANKDGSYNGSSANISGSGFAGMTFVVQAGSNQTFNQWVNQVRQSPTNLSQAAYNNLAAPSTNNEVSYYSSVANNIFNNSVNKYITPASSSSETSSQVQNAYSGMGM